MKFLFDNNLSSDLAHGIAKLRRNFNEEIIHLRDKFPEDITDEDYLNTLIDEGGWSVISADRFKKSLAERKAIQNPRINVFVMAKSFIKMRAWPRTKVLVNRWEDITTLAGVTSGGLWEVRVKGKITPYQS